MIRTYLRRRRAQRLERVQAAHDAALKALFDSRGESVTAVEALVASALGRRFRFRNDPFAALDAPAFDAAGMADPLPAAFVRPSRLQAWARRVMRAEPEPRPKRLARLKRFTGRLRMRRKR